MTFQALRILNILRKKADRSCIETTKDKIEWADVYLDNVIVSGVTPHQLAGYLSDLTQKGYYRSNSKHFGLVRLN